MMDVVLCKPCSVSSKVWSVPVEMADKGGTRPSTIGKRLLNTAVFPAHRADSVRP